MTTNTIIPTQYLEQISPIKSASVRFLADAEQVTIIDDQTLGIATKLKKEVTSFINSTDNQRKEITRPARELVDAINAMAGSAVEPAIKAKQLVTQSILDYEAKKEAERKAEQARIAKINSVFLLGQPKETIAENEEMKAKIADYFNNLPLNDQDIPEIKLACSNLIERVNQKIIQLKEDEARKIEDERLAKIKAEQDSVALEQELERQRQEKIKRENEAEARRLADIQIKQALEAERLEKEKAESFKVATGIRTYTKFTIEDATLVPREYCEPSDKLINQAIRSGVTAIPGIKIYHEKK